MKVRVKYNSWFTKFIKRNGIVLYPYVLMAKSEEEERKRIILPHEWIHVQQIRRDGFLRFYLKYFGEWIYNLFKYKSHEKAYRNISYEKEAYSKDKKMKLPKKLM